jgi:hypothetical protein
MTLLLPLLLTATPAAPQAAQEKEHELLALYVNDAAALFHDPKDRALLDALRLIDDRIMELPGEIPGFEMPPQFVPLFAHLLTGAKTLRVVDTGDASAMLPLRAQLAMHEADAAAATRLNDEITSLLEMVGALLAAGDSMTLIEAPLPMPLAYGARGDQLVIALGEPLDTPFELGVNLLPGGITPDLVLRMDCGRMLEMVLDFVAMEEPAAADQLESMLAMFGLGDVSIHAMSGSDDARSYTVMNLPGYGKTMKESGLFPERNLTAADLKLIPQDAVWAMSGVMNISGTYETLLGVAEMLAAQEGVEDVEAMIQDMTGIDLRADVIAHLGSSYGLYTADSTGGGGLLSAVAYVEIANPDGFTPFLERMQSMVDGIGQSEANGYMRVRNWTHGAQTFTSLTFPGIPIPFEPTYAIAAGHMFLGLTPQAALGAVAQATGEGPSLLDNPRFREQFTGGMENVQGVSFFDSPRLLQDGYGLTSMLCSAIVNGTRSPRDAARDAGIVMPSYHELARGAKASVTVTRMRGDDLTSETRSDRSMLVNMTSVVGVLGSSGLFLALPMITALGVRQEMATAEWQDF